MTELGDVYAAMAGAQLRPVLDQPRALELLGAACPARRADGRRTHAAIVFALVCSMDHVTGAITATHEDLGERAARRVGRDRPYSHDTVARVIAALIAAEVLVLPAGMEGKSAAALRCRYNQAPTYFPVEAVPGAADTPLVDPHDETAVAAEAARIQARLDAELSSRNAPAQLVAYPSRSRREQGVTEVDTHSFYKGEDRKRSKFDPILIPTTAAERRRAVDWLRAELKIGVVRPWRLEVMLARHWKAGRSTTAIKRMICSNPDGRPHGPLPIGVDRDEAVRRSAKPAATVTDVLLGCIGYRLNLWGWIAGPAATPATTRVLRPATDDWRLPAETLTAQGESARDAVRAEVARVAAAARAARATSPLT